MKSILYVGATLMIGASIYGFVDYKKTSKEKEFNSLYNETKTPAPVVDDDAIIPAVVIENPVEEKKQAELKDEPAAINAVTVQEKEKKAVSTKPVVKKAKKKKKLDHRIFSRAPLKEYIEEEILPAPPVETKKSEEKEQ